MRGGADTKGAVLCACGGSVRLFVRLRIRLRWWEDPDLGRLGRVHGPRWVFGGEAAAGALSGDWEVVVGGLTASSTGPSGGGGGAVSPGSGEGTETSGYAASSRHGGVP